MQTDRRRRARQRKRRRRQSDDPTTPHSGVASDAARARAETTESDATETTTTGTETTGSADGEHAVAVALERLIWTIMSTFSLLLATGAAMLTVRTDGPAAVGLALAAVVVAVSAAYFLYHMWRSPEDAQEF